MSWSIFKEEMLLKMQNPNWSDVSEFANFFTQKYDECMKRGFDNITNNTVIKGNTDLMRITVTNALVVGNLAKTEAFYNQSLNLLGKGTIAYWTGAELTKVVPITPAPGTVLNLGVVSNTCSNPGVWPDIQFPIPPSTTSNLYLDGFIILANIHLQSVSGFCNTISQYPPIAPIGPAILPWQGFTIDKPPASQSKPPLDEELVKKIIKPLSDEDFVMSEEDVTVSLARYNAAVEEFEKRKLEDELSKVQMESDATFAKLEYEEFIAHEQTKLDTKKNVSIDTDDSRLDDIELNDYINRIIEAARADLGVREIGGNNAGPRVEQMLKAVGFGKGAPWCAAAVSAWWRKAGILNPNTRGFDGDAACVNWKTWAQKNGLWTRNPVVGGAIVYRGYNKDLKKFTECHIGVVINYNPTTGEIVTIEGNTVAQGFNREGGGVYQKVTTLKQLLKENRLSGFVIPVERAKNPIRN